MCVEISFGTANQMDSFELRDGRCEKGCVMVGLPIQHCVPVRFYIQAGFKVSVLLVIIISRKFI